ncbi:MAG: GNAT family N-acetyltransferase [Rhodobacteraceae bacterium]|nr:GNAT family N-acetyltransferase [Paracoccaceae bacterium]
MSQSPATIVQADDSHAAEIARIWNPIIEGSEVTFNSAKKTPEEIAGMIAEKRRKGVPFLVACCPTVAGFATFGQFRSGVGYRRTMEHTIIVAPEAQGQSMGRMLMEGLEAAARAQDVHSMIGAISAANDAGLRFHLALGYVEIARLPSVGYKFGRHYDLILVQKLLQA